MGNRDKRLMGGVIKSVLNDDLTEAKMTIKKLVASRMQNLIEFKRGAIRIVGDDVVVNGKKVGTIENDLTDYKRGIVITLDDGGEEHDFTTIEEMYKFLMDKFLVTEGAVYYDPETGDTASFRVTEGYKVLPGIDRERYQERQGLEGPFRARNGKVVYYDPKEGKYYDPDTDIYISFDEWEAMDR
jgi:hypothetical protein